MGKEISSRWRATNAEQRKRFEELAAQDAIRYKKEVQIYEEEQILKARRMRETAKQSSSDQSEGTAAPSMAMPSGLAALDNRANALLAAASLRGMEETNHPDAPQRLSPPLGPMTTDSMRMSSLQTLSALEMARQQHQQQTINQMLLANEMQAMQQQAFQRQLALGSLPQGPTSNALLLEQLRRQEEFALLASSQRQDPQEALLHDYLRLQQQQQQQLQELGSLGALRGGGMGLSLSGGLGSLGGLGPQASAFASTMQHPYLQSPARAPSLQSSTGSGASAAAATLQGANLQGASLQGASLPVYSGSDADRMALMRSLSQPKPDDKR